MLGMVLLNEHTLLKSKKNRISKGCMKKVLGETLLKNQESKARMKKRHWS